jgi:hypothetical protein
VKHTFTIVKRIAASRSNVVANYLDLEHMPFHHGFVGCRVLSETERVACFEMSSRVGPLLVRNVHYYEYRPPNQIFHAIKSPLGPMYVVSTVKDAAESPAAACEVTVETTLDMPRLVYPARKLVERLLRHLNDAVLREDRLLLERRQALFGDDVEDYLRDGQCLLFKEAFRRHYARERSGARAGSAAG